MIPLRDSSAPRRLMPINLSLIAANLAVFGYEISLERRVGPFVARYAMVPAQVTSSLRLLEHAARGASAGSDVWPPITIFTSMFIHGGFLHIAGNMLYLYVFGAAVEYRLGHARYLTFYLASGVASALVMIWIGPGSRVPVIGASGAIAGMLGAYLVLFPRGRVLTILPIFFFFQFIELPSALYLLVWFGAQLYSGLAEGARTALMGGVAWWAHVGGFLFGVAAGPSLARDRRPMRRRIG